MMHNLLIIGSVTILFYLIYLFYQIIRNEKVYNIRRKLSNEDDKRWYDYHYYYMIKPSFNNYLGFKYPNEKDFKLLKEMIYARELRIGNYVNLICDGHEHEPDTFQWSIEDYEYYENLMFNILPIPITQQYLLSLGAEKIPKNRSHVELYCFKDMDCTEWCVGYRDDSWFLFKGKSDAMCNAVNYLKLEYIHKLQNLLFEVANLKLTSK
tara:strand:+ start:569 stop:1195 length:627 start_codon:yes stop_codon:yes gene_type:complete